MRAVYWLRVVCISTAIRGCAYSFAIAMDRPSTISTFLRFLVLYMQDVILTSAYKRHLSAVTMNSKDHLPVARKGKPPQLSVRRY